MNKESKDSKKKTEKGGRTRCDLFNIRNINNLIIPKVGPKKGKITTARAKSNLRGASTSDVNCLDNAWFWNLFF